MERVLLEVGTAVLEVQTFEMTMVPVYQFFRFATEEEYLAQREGRIPKGAWKQPLAALVNELEGNDRIDAALATRLRTFAEQRHALIHRWILQNGWPGNELGADAYEPLQALAVEVRNEAVALRKLISSRALAAATNHPDVPMTAEDIFGPEGSLPPGAIDAIHEQLRAQHGIQWSGGKIEPPPDAPMLRPTPSPSSNS
jgi:hypothetical protein